jgi:ketosteroid isomerase-like protein
MYPEPAEVVMRSLRAWGDDDLDGWLATFDPAVEWQTALGRVVGGVERVYRGREGMCELWRFYTAELEYFRSEVQELHEAADGQVVLLGRFEWTSPASGLRCESHVGMVMTVDAGRIKRARAYFSHDEALAAAGSYREASRGTAPPG